MPKLLLAIALLCCPALAHAEDAAIARLFEASGIDGTLLIESAKTGRRFVHNQTRARQAFTAASTFKVLNTLIALEERAIAGKDGVFTWDGTQYEIAEWNRDQTLEHAFKVSCVWCYQQLARRVGAEKYPTYIRQAGFGQLHQPFDGVRFWLDGTLTISAEQQVAFLKRVAERQLPFKTSGYDTLRAIMLAEKTPSYRLYGKTGWAAGSTPQVGWYVGYVQTADDLWLFALNLDTRSTADLPVRQQLVMQALRAKGILD
ncbi:beta-lactamase class D [Pseudomonas benzenivorans]|nr:class D beta-lactamase [Pseudomonas benzenivorans]SDG31871.1 beta-lactamase class D [Pseudomonas benzenivorans]